jgi:hypothetical protein
MRYITISCAVYNAPPASRRAQNLQNAAGLIVNPTGLPGAQQYNCHSFLKKVIEIPADKALE